MYSKISKYERNLHCDRDILPMRVTSGGARLCRLAPGQHSSKETPHCVQAVADTMSNLINPKIEPLTSSVHSDVFHHYINRIDISFPVSD